ncbi:amidohydrolase family protein [Thermodesulfobacteriota bacterium]
MILFLIPIFLLSIGCITTTFAASTNYVGPIINTHTQYDHKIEIDEVLRIVKEARISKIILSGRGNRTNKDVIAAAKVYPNIIFPAARTKFNFYFNGGESWSSYLDSISHSKLVIGLQELLLYHAAKINSQSIEIAPEIVVRAQDSRIARAISIATLKGYPITLHYEFRFLDERKRQQYFADMEKLFRAHPDQTFTLMHMGQLDKLDIELLIKDHSNVYFQLSMTANVHRGTHYPWTFMFVEGGEIGQLQPQWKDLLERYPERFLLAFDGVFTNLWRRDYVRDAQEWRVALGTLTKQTADLISHGNAERLWPIFHK